MAKAAGEMFELVCIPGVWERCLFIKKSQPGQIVQSLLEAKLSTRGEMPELRARLLRHEIRKTYPSFKVPWYAEDDDVEEEESGENTPEEDYDDSDWREVEKRLLVTMFEAKIRVLEEKLQNMSVSPTGETNGGIGEGQNCEKYEQELWGEKEVESQEQLVNGIVDEQKMAGAPAIKREYSKESDQILMEDQIEYRIKCIELLDRWKFSYDQKYIDHFYIINELRAFQNYAKISDRVLFEILPRIFDGKGKLWYNSYSLKKWTWQEFEHEFLLNCPGQWIRESKPFCSDI